MLYIGIRSTSEIPTTAVSTELDREEMVHGRLVRYWHVWVRDPDAIKPVFRPDEEPHPAKIRALDKFFEFWK